MAVEQTKIPVEELELFNSLPDIKVVFDVGARTDVDYLELKPDIVLHAFEPNPEFFLRLAEKVGTRPNTYLNNWGLSDSDGNLPYNYGRQGFLGGEEKSITHGEITLLLRTLDAYVAERGIQNIDFLKIDTEGYDFRVLLGALNTIPKCRYIQYEHWNDLKRFHVLLGRDFKMEYVGYRNVLCTRL